METRRSLPEVRKQVLSTEPFPQSSLPSSREQGPVCLVHCWSHAGPGQGLRKERLNILEGMMAGTPKHHEVGVKTIQLQSGAGSWGGQGSQSD